MNFQRSLLFLAANGVLTRLYEGSVWKAACLPWGRLAVIFVALNLSAMAADRVEIAGAAATVGTINHLKTHPTHRAAFEATVMAMASLLKRGVTNEGAYIELLHSLPLSSFETPHGDLYVSSRLVVYDATTKTSSRVSGMAAIRKVYSGIRMGLAPPPPAIKRKVAKPTI